jgi:hypothetical protein
MRPEKFEEEIKMRMETVNIITHFADHYGHGWATESDFSDLWPTSVDDDWASEQRAIVETLAKMDAIREEKSDPRLPEGIRVWDEFKTYADTRVPNEPLLYVTSYSHTTWTGRTRLHVNEDGVFTLSIWRPGKVIPYPVLAVQGKEENSQIKWGEVDAMGEALVRHWAALIEAMEALR